MKTYLDWNPRRLRTTPIRIELSWKQHILDFQELDDLGDDFIRSVHQGNSIPELRTKQSAILSQHSQLWERVRRSFDEGTLPQEILDWYSFGWCQPIYQNELMATWCNFLTKEHVANAVGGGEATPRTPKRSNKTKGPKTFRTMVQESMAADLPPDMDDIVFELESDDSMPVEPPWVDIPKRRKVPMRWKQS